MPLKSLSEIADIKDLPAKIKVIQFGDSILKIDTNQSNQSFFTLKRRGFCDII